MSCRIALLLLTALLLCGAESLRSEDVPIPEKSRFHLYLLVGQSNMAGRGKVTDQDKIAHPRVLMLSRKGEWVPAVDPLHFDKPVAGVGLGRTFGIEMAEENPDIVVGLIPCAVGGSPIQAWEPGGYHASTKTHPWDDMVKRAETALEKGTLKGILWHQGESDSNENLAPGYEKRLHQLIERFRSTLAAPDVPFLAGGMGRWEKRPWDEWKVMVDTAHRQLPEKVAATAYVSSEGLRDRDGVHFDRESYLEFGKRYAEAFHKLRGKGE